MKWSWRLITIRGIDIKVHLTFVLALMWGAFMWGGGRVEGAVYGLVLTLVLFGIVLLHELGHAFAAQHYGIPVQDIILLPIGGVARLSHMPEDPRQELVVAIAGPAVNLALGFLAAPVLLLGLLFQAFAGEAVRWPSMIDPGFLNFVGFFVMVNVSLLLFNMLPAFPMDGGRVLRAFLAQRMPYARCDAVGRPDRALVRRSLRRYCHHVGELLPRRCRLLRLPGGRTRAARSSRGTVGTECAHARSEPVPAARARGRYSRAGGIRAPDALSLCSAAGSESPGRPGWPHHPHRHAAAMGSGTARPRRPVCRSPGGVGIGVPEPGRQVVAAAAGTGTDCEQASPEPGWPAFSY